MILTTFTAADCTKLKTADTIYEHQLGDVLCTLLISPSGEKLAAFTHEGSTTGWLASGGIDLHQLWPDQIEETFEMGRNRTTQTAGGIPLHTLEWPGAPAPVYIIETATAGAFMLFPPGCFEGHADTHDAALA